MTTGIPAALAFSMVGHSAPGLGSVTAMALTRLLIASWISWACWVGSSLLEYFRVMLSLAAAADAPARMMSQNVSPAAAWVIMAIVYRGVLAWPALTPLAALAAASAALLPPVALHEASRTVRIMSSAALTSAFLVLSIWVTSG